MLNSSGKVAEGSAENIFIIKNGIIKTPPLNADILNGITRDSIIRLIKSNGIKLIEKNITVKELLKADEVFMTGTAAEVKSVAKINKITIGNGKIGNITKTLQKSFMDVTMGKEQKFAFWLRYI
jgi:branched-chain amino acid aminotransferase